MPPLAPQANLDWLFIAAGWCLATAGIVLLLWALSSDRSRGRRRCPRCWYDMNGVPGLTCPECGRAARSERGLRRTRRFWRWGAVGLATGVAGYATTRVPEYRRGWERVIPSTVLIQIAPASAESASAALTPLSVITFTGLAGAPPPAPGPAQRLTDEVWRRMRAGELWRWQAQSFMAAFLRSSGVDPREALSLPVAWPVGEPLPGRVSWPSFFAGSGDLMFDVGGPAFGSDVRLRRGRLLGSAAHTVWLGTPRRDTDLIAATIHLSLKEHEVYRSGVTIPVRIRGTRETFLDRIDSAGADEAVRAALDVQLLRDDQGRLVIGYLDSAANHSWSSIDFGVDFRIQVLVDGEVVGRAVGTAIWDDPTWLWNQRASVLWEANGQERLERALLTDRSTVRLRVIGAPDRACLSFMNNPFNKKRPACWAGSFEVPVRAP